MITTLHVIYSIDFQLFLSVDLNILIKMIVPHETVSALAIREVSPSASLVSSWMAGWEYQLSYRVVVRTVAPVHLFCYIDSISDLYLEGSD